MMATQVSRENVAQVILGQQEGQHPNFARFADRGANGIDRG